MSPSKCRCLSAPQYHREDCPIYDIYGVFKNEDFSLLSFYNAYVELKQKKEVYLKPLDLYGLDFIKKVEYFLSKEEKFFEINKDLLNLTKNKIDSNNDLKVKMEVNNIWDLLLIKEVHINRLKRKERLVQDDRLIPYINKTKGYFIFHEDLADFLKDSLKWSKELIRDFIYNYTQTRKLMDDLKRYNFDEKIAWDIVEDRKSRFSSKKYSKAKIFAIYLDAYLNLYHKKSIEEL